eukprot:1154320-Pelagomonas_calceolata.AAC.6
MTSFIGANAGACKVTGQKSKLRHPTPKPLLGLQLGHQKQMEQRKVNTSNLPISTLPPCSQVKGACVLQAGHSPREKYRKKKCPHQPRGRVHDGKVS